MSRLRPDCSLVFWPRSVRRLTRGIRPVVNEASIRAVDSATGPAGPAGIDGAAGKDGPIGAAGVDRAVGAAGVDGTAGTAGTDGTAGDSRINLASGWLALFALVAALYLARGFFVPLLIGIFPSYALHPLVDGLEACRVASVRHWCWRWWSGASPGSASQSETTPRR